MALINLIRAICMCKDDENHYLSIKNKIERNLL